MRLSCERLKRCPSISLKAVGKIMTKLCQESQCPVGDADRLLVRRLATCATCVVLDTVDGTALKLEA